jgi:choline dehydrogenase
MRPFAKGEVMPGDLKGRELAAFIRAAAVTVFHSTGTARMGRDGTSVVDGHLNGAMRDHRGARWRHPHR